MGFYTDALSMDSKNTPWPQDMGSGGPELSQSPRKNGGAHVIDSWFDGDDQKYSYFYEAKSGDKMYGPRSLMNENVAINYRTISNAYNIQGGGKDFTEYNDYKRCMSAENGFKKYQKDVKNPTYSTILGYYGDSNHDSQGLAKYRIQDFIYLKYYNQIPNNYMVTLRRYTRPCEDHMFGLDMTAQQVNSMNDTPESHFAIATAVTYLGEKTGNKLSDILKFEYGANWEDKEAEVQSLQSSDGGLAAQMRDRAGISENIMRGEGGISSVLSANGFVSMFAMSAMVQAKGQSVPEAMANMHKYPGDEFDQRYGNEFYGDINVIQNVKLRKRGLTFSNSFSLNFEYSLKSLQCVNPRVAMLDILSNFYILTGNYGTFWGGATIFYGNRNIAPQFGDPNLLRQGRFGDYIKSMWNDIKSGFQTLGESGSGEDSSNGGVLSGAAKGIGSVLKGGLQAIMGNIFGGSLGVAGESQAPKALLSGAPSGYWHLTIGNPLNPIAMMGNMAVTKTTVQFSDALGYDDFPTEVKFTVEMEHCRPRDNAGIENMFNAGKGRFYAFANPDLEMEYKTVDVMKNFEVPTSSESLNTMYDNNGIPRPVDCAEKTQVMKNDRIRVVAGQLNN